MQSIRYVLKISSSLIIIVTLFFSEAVNVSSSLEYLIRLISYIVIPIMILGSWRKIIYVMNRDISLVLLVLITVFSIFWSVDPSQTLRQIMPFLRTTLLGVYLAACYTNREQMRIISRVVGLQIAINLLVLILFPSYGWSTDNNWSGIYSFKQFLGRVMSLCAAFCLVIVLDKQSNKFLSIIGLVSSVMMMLISHSKTYLIAFVASTLFLPLYKISRQKFKIRVVVICCLVMIFGVIGSLSLANWQTIVVNVLGKDIEFNGRTPVWQIAIEKLLERPWLGYGYHAFWPSDQGRYVIQHTWAGTIQNLEGMHAHNAFLDLSLQIGLLGVTLLILNIYLLLQRLYMLLSLTKATENLWMLIFVINQLFGNLSEAPTYLGNWNTYWIIYVAVACSSAVEFSRVRRNRIGFVQRFSF